MRSSSDGYNRKPGTLVLSGSPGSDISLGRKRKIFKNPRVRQTSKAISRTPFSLHRSRGDETGETGVRGGGSSHWDSAETAGENRVHCAPRTVRDDIEVFSSPACRRLHAVMDLGKCNRMQILYLYFS